VRPILFHVGPLPIYGYGAMMAIAFLVAGALTGREMNRKGMSGEIASSFVFWAAVGGIAGSRLWAVAEDWRSFLADPASMIFSGAGFVWYGGLLGGTLAVSMVIRHHRLPWLRTVDCIAPGLALAYGIGRIGCQLAGDGDWGTVSDLPWAMAYPHAIVGWDYPPGVRVHPAPVYETLLSTGIFAALWSMRKRPLRDGDLFWWYLILTSVARFVVEFVRINKYSILGMTHPQAVSVVLIAIGAWRLLAGSAEPVPPRPRKLARPASR
jgi:phosphatidylglycerol:prolipoprotein diacylglycerol transferase